MGSYAFRSSMCRICYMLSMLNIMFHVDVEEVYIGRISVSFNSFDDGPAKSWNDLLSYDEEINMNDFFRKKTNCIFFKLSR